MGIAILIIGKSGSGKSTSLRSFQPGDVGIINVLGKPLPFRNNLPSVETDDYKKVMSVLTKSTAKSIVVDDCGYLMTNQFMKGHANVGKGNDIFGFYNTIGDQFWRMITFVKELPADKLVYFMMHEDKNDFGDIKPKTIGKMLDEKVCVEGMFTIALRCKEHKFFTQTTDGDIAKTPMGMFDSIEIDNDLKMVDETIRNYYNLGGNNNEKTE